MTWRVRFLQYVDTCVPRCDIDWFLTGTALNWPCFSLFRRNVSSYSVVPLVLDIARYVDNFVILVSFSLMESFRIAIHSFHSRSSFCSSLACFLNLFIVFHLVVKQLASVVHVFICSWNTDLLLIFPRRYQPIRSHSMNSMRKTIVTYFV